AYPKGWTEWVKESRAEAIPGALEFLKYAASKGVDVFYVTNRKDEEKEATIRNLKKLGFPNSTERFVMTRSKESSKEPRRNEIEKTHEIVLLAGDNLNDFTDDFEKKNVRQRMSAVDRLEKQDLWGRK